MTRRWRKVLIIGGSVLAGLVLLVTVLGLALEEPLRRAIERRMNEQLAGYTARVKSVDFHPLGFGLDVEEMVVRQNAHPEPPVLHIPELKASVNWKALLFFRLVADFKVNNPSVHVNLAQLQSEVRDRVAFNQRGWQDAFQAIYPLKINELRIHNGKLVYRDTSGFRPLHATKIEMFATNIRNIRSKDREYPSTIHVKGVLFDKGGFVIDGNADFLAKPMPGVHAALDLDGVQLDYFEPVVQRYALKLRRGILDGRAQVEYGSNVQIVDIDSLVIRDAVVDYLYTAAPNARVVRAAREIKRTAKEAMNDERSLFRVRNLKLVNGVVGLVNRDASPRYRVYVSNANLTVENLSSQARDGVARAIVSGNFMGSGEVSADAKFFPEGKEPNFHARLRVAETQIAPMNDLLRAHGGFDVTRGVFSLYTDVRVRDGYIRGYVKPLFRNLNVYDSKQDKEKNPFKKMYEAVVGGVAKILENRRDEVATVASLDGPVSGKNTSTLEIIGGLMRNAFIDAILPGFEREYRRTDPLEYRRVKKREEERREARPARRPTSASTRTR